LGFVYPSNRYWDNYRIYIREAEMMKTCPFRRYELGEPLIIKNIESSDKELEELRDARLVKLRISDEAPSITPIHAMCNEADCALWDAERNCCSFRSDPVKKEADHA
jgi:hypothetical protein